MVSNRVEESFAVESAFCPERREFLLKLQGKNANIVMFTLQAVRYDMYRKNIVKRDINRV